ncbi:hypothetical protein [Ferruginibacter sp.]
MNYIKKIFFSVLVMFATITVLAQEKKLYDPTADAEKDIAAAVKKAKAENKYVLLQGGGNWCSWCIEFARFAKADKKNRLGNEQRLYMVPFKLEQGE